MIGEAIIMAGGIFQLFAVLIALYMGSALLLAGIISIVLFNSRGDTLTSFIGILVILNLPILIYIPLLSILAVLIRFVSQLLNERHFRQMLKDYFAEKHNAKT